MTVLWSWYNFKWYLHNVFCIYFEVAFCVYPEVEGFCVYPVSVLYAPL